MMTVNPDARALQKLIGRQGLLREADQAKLPAPASNIYEGGEPAVRENRSFKNLLRIPFRKGTS